MKRAKAEANDEETHLSGAYIRSFVKQLSSSSRNPMTGAETPNPHREAADPSPPPPKPHKKQVRRRLQTRKPYQEKLLNMAEARREIVSALKLHRAAMKQQQQQQQQLIQSDQKSRRNPRIYASISPWPSPPPPPQLPPNLPAADSAAALFDFALPRQALGLNLNLHDFFINTAPSSSSSSSIYSSSSPSTSSSSPPPPPPPPEIPPAEFGFSDCGGLIGGEDEKEEEIASSPFDEVMEFPPWVNANESCVQQVDHRDFSVLPCMEIEEIEGMDGDWLA